jgi:UDP-3-O-[3-hydroxymyristoyl] glucosamine N-acyltransferase
MQVTTHKTEIHPTALVDQAVRLGPGVKIGPFSIIHTGVEIGEGTEIGAYSEIGLPTNAATKTGLVIGSRCVIRSHAVIYSGSRLGQQVQLGHYVSIRENTDIGDGVLIGTRSQIEGDCEIGDFTRLHSEVHVGKLAKIGRCAWLYPKVQFTNDPLPPTHVMESVLVGAYIGAASVVRESVPAVMFATGNPAKPLFQVDRLIDPQRNLKFRWLDDFRDRYPVSAQPLIDKLTHQAQALLAKT